MSISGVHKMTMWQVGILKLGVLFLGIAIGAYWWEALLPYVTWFVVIGLILAAWAGYNWMKK